LRNRNLKLALVAAAASFAALPLLAGPALADPAPSSTDAVGVGSDTVQYASDFVADGDFLADSGFNQIGGSNRVMNFDATPDADARLAYGADGVGTGTCPPGLGATVGTGNATGSHADKPCILNPTVVLRAGTQPVQRINGSGAGGKAGALDTQHLIDYVRASSSQESNLSPTGSGLPKWSSITIGTDPLDMLVSSTPATNAPALSAAELKSIYTCAITKWNALPGAPAGASADTIIPIIPQLGSGTRSSFETAIGVTDATLGSCVQVGEENDPFAISNVPASLTPAGSAADAIEPMSGGRLNLFLGKLGSANGVPGGPNGVGGYFEDPSCPVEVTTPAACVGAARVLTPHVTLVTTGTPTDGNTVFGVTRNLLIYFRDADETVTTKFEPGSTRNLVQTLFYNPCTSGIGCITTATGTFASTGVPYYATTAGQALIAAAGIDATYTFNTDGP
jgi:hypothetical protein